MPIFFAHNIGRKLLGKEDMVSQNSMYPRRSKKILQLKFSKGPNWLKNLSSIESYWILGLNHSGAFTLHRSGEKESDLWACLCCLWTMPLPRVFARLSSNIATVAPPNCSLFPVHFLLLSLWGSPQKLALWPYGCLILSLCWRNPPLAGYEAFRASLRHSRSFLCHTGARVRMRISLRSTV